MTDTVVVTGGAGFIGSHVCKALAEAGFRVIVLDDLSTGHADAVRWGPLVQLDIADAERTRKALAKSHAQCVIHCAASAYVGESVIDPRKYYGNNVVGGMSLLDACLTAGIDRLVFSSSCATYGVPQKLPIREDCEQKPINPYGRTKLVFEQALEDYSLAYGLHFVALRYFNAAGADPSGELAERHEPETHLIPRALQAASGRLSALEIFGNDYDTPDGTCIRDYVHVSDLADAHVAAVKYLLAGGNILRVNLGSGRGTSIGEILHSISHITGRLVPVISRQRRAGDPPVLFADSSRARSTLGFVPRRSDIATIIRTAAPTFGLGVMR